MNIEKHIENLRKEAQGKSFSLLAERCETSANAPYRIRKAECIKKDDVVVLCLAGSGGDKIFMRGYNSMLKKVDNFIKKDFGQQVRVVVALSEFGNLHDNRLARKALNCKVSWPKYYEELKNSVDKKYYDETFEPKYIKDIFDEVLAGRIADDKGDRLKIDEALRNIRKVNIVAHCHGGYVAMVLEEMMRKRMDELGYDKKEQKKILEEMLVVAYSPDCPYMVSDTKFVGLFSSQDRSNRYNNYMREWLLMEPRKFGLMYLPHKWGRTFMCDKVNKNEAGLVEIGDLFSGNEKCGVDEHQFLGFSADESMSDSGKLLQRFGANVIYNGVLNSLNQEKKFVKIPNIEKLVIKNFNDRVEFAKACIIGYRLEQKLHTVDKKKIDDYANFRRSIPVVELD